MGCNRNCTNCKPCQQRQQRRGLGFLYSDGGGSFDVIEGGDEYYDSWDFGGWDGYGFQSSDDGGGGYYGFNSWDEFSWAFFDELGYFPEDAGIENPYGYETLDTINTNEAYALPDYPGIVNNFPDYSQLPGSYDPWTEFYANVPDAPPAAAGPQVPGYCPAGYYHPLNDPFACVPFPANDAAAKRAAAQAAAQKAAAAKQAAAQKCPTGYTLDPKTKKCVKAPTPGALVSRTPAPSKTALPWWVWAIGAAVALKVVSGDGDSTARRRR